MESKQKMNLYSLLLKRNNVISLSHDFVHSLTDNCTTSTLYSKIYGLNELGTTVHFQCSATMAAGRFFIICSTLSVGSQRERKTSRIMTGWVFFFHTGTAGTRRSIRLPLSSHNESRYLLSRADWKHSDKEESENTGEKGTVDRNQAWANWHQMRSLCPAEFKNRYLFCSKNVHRLRRDSGAHCDCQDR